MKNVVMVPQGFDGQMLRPAHDIQTQKMTPGMAVSPMSPKAFSRMERGKHETPSQSRIHNRERPDVVIQEYASMTAEHSREHSRSGQKGTFSRLQQGKKYSTRDFNATDTAILEDGTKEKEDQGVAAGGGEKLKTEIRF